MKDIEAFLKSQKTWLDIEKVEKDTIILGAFAGDVGEETPGPEDAAEARRLGRVVRERFPNADTTVEVVDEWTNLTIRRTESVLDTFTRKATS